MNKIEKFLKALRESCEPMYKIFTEGSCYQLYNVIKALEPTAEPMWSDIENHCVVKVGNKYYDIGGRISSEYIDQKDYFVIAESKRDGYNLMRYIEPDDCRGITVQKYYRE